jgi:hypothetical protein
MSPATGKKKKATKASAPPAKTRTALKNRSGTPKAPLDGAIQNLNGVAGDLAKLCTTLERRLAHLHDLIDCLLRICLQQIPVEGTLPPPLPTGYTAGVRFQLTLAIPVQADFQNFNGASVQFTPQMGSPATWDSYAFVSSNPGAQTVTFTVMPTACGTGTGTVIWTTSTGGQFQASTVLHLAQIIPPRSR